jgi:hypothetical protein
MHQPERDSMDDEPHLIGRRAVARHAIHHPIQTTVTQLLLNGPLANAQWLDHCHFTALNAVKDIG